MTSASIEEFSTETFCLDHKPKLPQLVSRSTQANKTTRSSAQNTRDEAVQCPTLFNPYTNLNNPNFTEHLITPHTFPDNRSCDTRRENELMGRCESTIQQRNLLYQDKVIIANPIDSSIVDPLQRRRYLANKVFKRLIDARDKRKKKDVDERLRELEQQTFEDERKRSEMSALYLAVQEKRINDPRTKSDIDAHAQRLLGSLKTGSETMKRDFALRYDTLEKEMDSRLAKTASHILRDNVIKEYDVKFGSLKKEEKQATQKQLYEEVKILRDIEYRKNKWYKHKQEIAKEEEMKRMSRAEIWVTQDGKTLSVETVDARRTAKLCDAYTKLRNSNTRISNYQCANGIGPTTHINECSNGNKISVSNDNKENLQLENDEMNITNIEESNQSNIKYHSTSINPQLRECVRERLKIIAEVKDLVQGEVARELFGIPDDEDVPACSQEKSKYSIYEKGYYLQKLYDLLQRDEEMIEGGQINAPGLRLRIENTIMHDIVKNPLFDRRIRK